MRWSVKKATRELIRQQLKEAAIEVIQLGGWSGFNTGEWLFHLIERDFQKYSESATSESLAAKYPGCTREQIAQKLIGLSAKKAALVGALTGIAVSADELVALFTAGEAGVGLPANIAIAATAICAEVFVTAKIQLQLVAQLAALYGNPFDLADPQDILTIMNSAFGGGVTELASKEAAKVGARFSEAAIGRYYAKRKSFEVLKRIARKLSYRLLRRFLVNAIVPGVSMFMGAIWNKRTTKAAGRLALRHLKERTATL